jgi:hypothetical protein
VKSIAASLSLVAFGCGGKSVATFAALNRLTLGQIQGCEGCVITVAQVPTAYTRLGTDGRFELDLKTLEREVSFLSTSQQFLVFKVRGQNGAPMYESPRFPIDSVRVWLSEERDPIFIPLGRAASDDPAWEGEPPEVIQQEGPVRDG